METLNQESKDKQIKKEYVKKALADVFGLRLQALIAVEDDQLTTRIVDHFIKWAEELSKEPDNHNQSDKMIEEAYTLLSFNTEGDEANVRAVNIKSAIQSIDYLSTYVEGLYNRLCKEYVTDSELQKANYDRRKAVGEKFKNKMHRTPHQEGIDRYGIYDQLNHMTLNRNTFFHAHTSGDSITFDGYRILTGYDVLMSCLLYTFYHMILTDDYQPDLP